MQRDDGAVSIFRLAKQETCTLLVCYLQEEVLVEVAVTTCDQISRPNVPSSNTEFKKKKKMRSPRNRRSRSIRKPQGQHHNLPEVITLGCHMEARGPNDLKSVVVYPCCTNVLIQKVNGKKNGSISKTENLGGILHKAELGCNSSASKTQKCCVAHVPRRFLQSS